MHKAAVFLLGDRPIPNGSWTELVTVERPGKEYYSKAGFHPVFSRDPALSPPPGADPGSLAPILRVEKRQTFLGL